MGRFLNVVLVSFSKNRQTPLFRRAILKIASHPDFLPFATTFHNTDDTRNIGDDDDDNEDGFERSFTQSPFGETKGRSSHRYYSYA